MSGKAEGDRESSRRDVNKSFMTILVTAIFVAPVFLIVTPVSAYASAAWYVTDLGIDGFDYTVPTGINVHDQVSALVNNEGGASEAIVYNPDLGSWTTLPNLGEEAWTEGINDAGEIVGVSRSSPITAVQGVYWPSSSSSGPIIKLLPLAGESTSEAMGLNDVHRAVGASWGPYGAAVVWDLNPLATDIPAQEIGSVAGMDDTIGLDINNNGAIIGYANLRTAEDHRQAFYCEGIGYPILSLIPLSGGVDGSDSVAEAINDAGLIVGYSRDTNDLIHAVIWTSPTDNPVDLGLANPSYANDVNDDGTIVGYAAQPDGNSGFIYHNYPNGPLEFLERPSGATAYNNPVAINDLGHVVSYVEMSDYERHTFLWTPVLEDLGNLAGYDYVDAQGINTNGQVVAVAYNSGWMDYKAIVWDPLVSQWRSLYDLGSSMASHINEAGDIAGYIEEPDHNVHQAVLWTAEGLMVDLTGSPGDMSTAYACNNRNPAGVVQVVGWVAHVTTLWTVDTSLPTPTVVATPLVHSYGVDLIPRDINDWGAIVGYAQFSPYDAFYYDKNVGFKILPRLDPYGEAIATGINFGGQIAGYLCDATHTTRAAVWDNSSTTPSALETSGGRSLALSINDRGLVVGRSAVSGDQAVLWDTTRPGYPRVELGIPTGMAFSEANGINSLGHVVGTGIGSDGLGTQVFLWTPPSSPPVALFTVDWVSATPTVTVRFDGSASFDPYGTIVGYAWDFGDSTTGSGMTVSHTYAVSGIYTVTLVVTDDEGLSSEPTSQSVDATWTQAPLEEIADLKDVINGTSTTDAIKQELSALAAKAEQIIEARKSHMNESATATLLTLITKVEQYTIVGKIDPGDGWDLTCEANLIIALLTNQVMIKGVPNYEWYHGCGPTAVGMIVGYWDTMRFSDLVVGDVPVQNDIANSMIASSGHIKDYAWFPDGWEVEQDIPGGVLIPDASEPNSPITNHTDDCIADFMHTSQSHDGLAYGQSLNAKVVDGFVEYVAYTSPEPTPGTDKYVGTAGQVTGKSLSWSFLTKQVKAQRPMAFVVDINGDHKGDHLVTVIGYCSIGKAKLYAFYSTWDDTIWWANFELMRTTSGGTAAPTTGGTDYFGIYSMYQFNIVINTSVA